MKLNHNGITKFNNVNWGSKFYKPQFIFAEKRLFAAVLMWVFPGPA